MGQEPTERTFYKTIMENSMSKYLDFLEEDATLTPDEVNKYASRLRCSNNEHYDNSNGSLYKFAEDHKLNSYEFDVIKRIVRCRKKGEWLKDINKTKDVLDIYVKEQRDKYDV